MAGTTLPGVLLTGTHGARPAATAVGTGTLYSCTTHSLIYQSDGATWSTWASLTGTGLADPMTTRGDIIIRNASNSTDRLGRGSAGQLLKSDGTDVAYGFPSAYGAKVYMTGTDSITDSTDESLEFDAEEFDDGAIHDTSSATSRLTLNRAGKWWVQFNVLWAASATGRRVCYLKKDGTGPIRGANINQQAPAAGQCQMAAGTTVVSNGSTYVEVWVAPVGVTLNVIADTTFEAYFIGV